MLLEVEISEGKRRFDMIVLQEITESEAREVMELVEKRVALKNLGPLLEVNSQYKSLFKECSAEYAAIEQKYCDWWNMVIAGYHLEKYQETEMVVDAISRTIQVL